MPVKAYVYPNGSVYYSVQENMSDDFFIVHSDMSNEEIGTILGQHFGVDSVQATHVFIDIEAVFDGDDY